MMVYLNEPRGCDRASSRPACCLLACMPFGAGGRGGRRRNLRSCVPVFLVMVVRCARRPIKRRASRWSGAGHAFTLLCPCPCCGCGARISFASWVPATATGMEDCSGEWRLHGCCSLGCGCRVGFMFLFSCAMLRARL